MTTYVIRDGKLVEKAEARRAQIAPHYWPDVPAYKSPMTGREVSSRRERKEEMKRFGVREVEPSEFTVRYQNAEFMRKHGIRNPED